MIVCAAYLVIMFILYLLGDKEGATVGTGLFVGILILAGIVKLEDSFEEWWFDRRCRATSNDE